MYFGENIEEKYIQAPFQVVQNKAENPSSLAKKQLAL